MTKAEIVRIHKAMSGALGVINLLTVYGKDGPKTFDSPEEFQKFNEEVFQELRECLKITDSHGGTLK